MKKFTIKDEDIPIQFQKIKEEKIDFTNSPLPKIKIISIKDYSIKNYKINGYFKKISKIY